MHVRKSRFGGDAHAFCPDLPTHPPTFMQKRRFRRVRLVHPARADMSTRFTQLSRLMDRRVRRHAAREQMRVSWVQCARWRDDREEQSRLMDRRVRRHAAREHPVQCARWRDDREEPSSRASCADVKAVREKEGKDPRSGKCRSSGVWVLGTLRPKP